MKKILSISGLIFIFCYSCYAGNIFVKGCYRPNKTVGKPRANTDADNIVSCRSSRGSPIQKKQPQKLITVVTYYDEPDYGLTIIRDNDTKGVVYRNGSSSERRRKSSISKQQKKISNSAKTTYNNVK
ncbi:MAG: hypothetical protein Q8O30_06410 [Candidatus Omnitrophota bacterium]|nr:hypothetical protein [Candidatus Omnitrophota bacterium]